MFILKIFNFLVKFAYYNSSLLNKMYWMEFPVCIKIFV